MLYDSYELRYLPLFYEELDHDVSYIALGVYFFFPLESSYSPTILKSAINKSHPSILSKMVVSIFGEPNSPLVSLSGTTVTVLDKNVTAELIT